MALKRLLAEVQAGQVDLGSLAAVESTLRGHATGF